MMDSSRMMVNKSGGCRHSGEESDMPYLRIFLALSLLLASFSLLRPAAAEGTG